MNKNAGQYLDVEINLQTGCISTYMKLNAKLRYMNAGFNNPVSVIMHSLKGIETDQEIPLEEVRLMKK